MESASLSLDEVANWLAQGESALASEEYQRLREHLTDFRERARDYGLTICPSLGL